MAKLVALNYSDPDKLPSYQDWIDISHALQAGLNTQQTAQLQATLDEALSAAASAYVIKNIASSAVSDRDNLYSWLLIDNQVSAQVKTTRLAEAIASVQLYVNRAMSGQEDGVVYTVKSGQFFIDWDMYNKRYSTWAGVSQLVYYPENYVDPTLRLGQTGMMDEMLQTLSQSQLTSDTVENAFKTYMTRFEEIANLDVISGYHDSVSDQTGTTYIIGRSAIGDYYWRSADINKMSDGKLPANAWSEWKKITAALTPVSNLVRPVIFQSRLYLVWVESREISTTEGTTTTKSTEYMLKYAHILHDGTWSGPLVVALDNDSIQPDTGMYCSQYVDLERLYVFFYSKQDSYSENPETLHGLHIQSDGSVVLNALLDAPDYIFQQLDVTEGVRLNSIYIPKVSVSSPSQISYEWGDGNYTIMSGGQLSAISLDLSADDHVILEFSPTGRIVHNGYAGTQSRDQISLMMESGNIGDTFYFPQKTSVTIGRPGEHYTGIGRKGSPNSFFAYISFSSAQAAMSFNMDFNSENWVDCVVIDLHTFSSEYGDIELENVGFGRQIAFDYNENRYVYDVAFSQFITLNTTIELAQVNMSVVVGNGSPQVFNSADERVKYTFDESLFRFNNPKIIIPYSTFGTSNTLDIEVTISATAPTGEDRWLGSETLGLTLKKATKDDVPVITLHRTDTYAQYLQYGVHRIRVNTLFAKQLVARANMGLDAVLSMETQQLQEPKLGEGTYITLVFDRYDSSIHGSSSGFEILMCDVYVDGDRFVLGSGMLSSERQTSCSFFLPRLDESTASPSNVYFCAKYQSGETDKLKVQKVNNQWGIDSSYNSGTFIGLINISDLGSQTEPMDFSGANALYFWEMFYYVPMMVFKRLLSEGKFTEATQWLKYIWSPDGYLINGQPSVYQWNVRPLEDETTWHADPLDSVDPDAVAQADPMHYKVATFMAYLDLLIARGDMAYRQLERDTLNEAKMWCVQALDILGDEPYLSLDSSWVDPRLSDAANKTTQTATQQTLMEVRQQVSSGMLRTANSLTNLFLPQQNEKLAGYWQTLAQRLYNLRHNLSIDGNPLSLSIYATPADPTALLSAAVMASQGGSDLPAAVMPMYRFPIMLESARNMVSQLSQFGSVLLSLTERQDAEALSELLQTQGSALVLQSVALQNKEIAALDADKAALDESRSGAQSRLESYTRLYDEDVNTGEHQAMDLFLSSSITANGGQICHTIGGGMDMVPNIFGFADGGSRWGAGFIAAGNVADLAAAALHTTADRISQSEAYRRRRQEWEIQRNNAQSEVKQIDAQLASLAVRREAAVLQKTYLETQQAQTQAQMAFLQSKFSNKALYNWLRGKLAAIYYQFYDLTVSRCLMAQEAYKWALNESAATFVRPGAWQGTYAGLMAGETLMLNLAQMEQAYLQKEEREKAVTRTVCLSEFYSGQSEDDAFALAESVASLVADGEGSAGTDDNGLTVVDKQLQASVKLSDLNIADDYPDGLGKTRRVKQISVTLPALVGPYQDVRAVLSYGGSVAMPRGCSAVAVSHGMADSGQFQLDFNDSRWLPFEGIPVDDSGTLVLSFPDIDDKQKDLLLSLTDIILHIRYTIVS